jgi:hypothetical protein
MTALYEDAGLTLDEGGITIHRYYFPFGNSKRVGYDDIQSIKSKKMGWASGKGRFWGTGGTRHWFPLDTRRGRKSLLLVLDVGRWVRPCIAEVIKLLKAKVKV